MKQPKPVARCTDCGRFSHRMEAIGENCPNWKDGCQGVMRSAMTVGDWQECSKCLVTGLANDQKCERCDGKGWRYVRGRPGLKRP